MASSIVRLLGLCILLSVHLLSLVEPAQAQDPIKVIESRGVLSVPDYQAYDKQIQAVLEKRLSVEVKETSLEEVLESFPQEISDVIRIDRRAFDDVGLSVDIPVSMRLKDVRLKNLLNLMLEPLDLTWYSARKQIFITTADAGCEWPVFHFYSAQELLLEDEMDSPDRFNSMKVMLETIIQPESWERLGGPGGIRSLDGGAVIFQVESVHQEIRRFVAALKKVQQLKNDSYDVTPVAAILDSELAKEIARELKNKIDAVDFEEATLVEVLDVVLFEQGINYHFDSQFLDELEIDAKYKLTGKWRSLPLELLLVEILGSYDLTYQIMDNIVLITTSEMTSDTPKTYIYPVKDFQQALKSKWGSEQRFAIPDLPNSRYAYQELANAITASVEDHAWEELGGSGAIAALPEFHCLVVSQTEEVHQKIDDFLSEIRSKRSAQPIDRSQQNFEKKIMTRCYYLNGLFSENSQPNALEIQRSLVKVADIIQREVDSKSWSLPGNYVEVIGDQLLIKHNVATHLSIESYLRNLRLIRDPQIKGSVEEQEAAKEGSEPAPAGSGAAGGIF